VFNLHVLRPDQCTEPLPIAHCQDHGSDVTIPRGVGVYSGHNMLGFVVVQSPTHTIWDTYDRMK